MYYSQFFYLIQLEYSCILCIQNTLYLSFVLFWKKFLYSHRAQENSFTHSWSEISLLKFIRNYSENVSSELVFQALLQFNCNQIYGFVPVLLLSEGWDLSKDSLQTKVQNPWTLSISKHASLTNKELPPMQDRPLR